jgi:O-antigen/teichoic acid export membrane protein
MAELIQAQTSIASDIGTEERLRFLAQVIRNKGLGAIVDQTLVSATNFLTTVIIGRAAGQDELGAYTLAFSMTLVLVCLQESLICLPYTIRHRRYEVIPRREFAGSTLLQAALLAVVLVLLMAIGALLTGAGNLIPMHLSIVLTFASPFILLRDFARRISFAHLDISRTIIVDSAVFVLQLGTLLALWRVGWLSATVAYVVIAAACAVGGTLWLWSFREHFLPGSKRLVQDFRNGWSLGGWVLSSQIVSILTTYLIYWLVAGHLGTVASGVLTACSAIILLTNPVTLGTYAYLTPRLSSALAGGGRRGVLVVALQTSAFLGTVMGAICLAAFVFGDLFLNLVYGAEFAGYANVSGLYGLFAVAQAVGAAPEHALWVTHRPQISFWTGLLGLACTVALAVWWMPMWGLTGAVSAMAIGSGLTAAMRWVAFLRSLGTTRPSIEK